MENLTMNGNIHRPRAGQKFIKVATTKGLKSNTHFVKLIKTIQINGNDGR